MTRRQLSTVVGAALLAVLLALTLYAVTKPSTGVAAERCAWPVKVGVDADNIDWPDTDAVYWSMPYVTSPGLKITVSGTFPDARYMSLNVYDADSASFTNHGVGSSLSDSQIVPDPGSVNPWRQHAAPGGRYTVTLTGHAAPGRRNTLPLAPAGTPVGTKGSVVYRVYLPAGLDFGALVLPTVTMTRDGVSTTLESCTDTDSDAATGRRPARAHDRGTDAFTRTDELADAAPNADNAYLSAWLTPPGADDVLVIRGKAARAVTGDDPVPWPADGVDMRYWSICTNLADPNGPVVANELADGSTDYGCRHDDDVRLDCRGYYTIVIGTEDQRAAVEENRSVTFVPLSASQPDASTLVLLRNLLPVDGFDHAVQDVPVGSTPEAAADIMGRYYPKVRTSTLDNLLAWSPPRC